MKAEEYGQQPHETFIDVKQREKERNYWINKLENYVKTSFPIDRHKKSSPQSRHKSISMTLKGELYTKLMRLSNNSDIRLYIILMAGLVLLLEKYTGNKDIAVGAPIYKQDIEGEFVNKILVLRNRLQDDMTFKELLLQVSNTNLEAVEHINYPLETIPYELDMSVTPGEFPLFEIAILLNNLHDKNYIGHLSLKVIFSFTVGQDEIIGEMEYDPDSYREEAAARIVRHYTHLMGRALDNLETGIADIPVMPEHEIEQLLEGFNAPPYAPDPDPKPIHYLIREQEKKNPHHIALRHNNHTWTYKQMGEKVGSLARQLKRKGVKSETLVAVLLEHSPELVTALLAVLNAGGAYLPIDPEYPPHRIDYFLADSETRHLITRTKPAREIEFTGTVIDPGIYDNEAGTGQIEMPAAVQPGGLAYVIYTSGTTAKPKGVMIDHYSLANYVTWAARTYVKGERLDFPLYSSISFDLTVTSLYTPLIAGGTILVYDGPEKSLVIEKIIGENKAGVIKLTPSHLYMIKYKDIRQSNLKCLIVGGELFETRIAGEIYAKFKGNVEIYNEYGPTEATVGCLVHKFEPAQTGYTSVPIGGPIAGTRVYILDGNQGPVPIGVSGEIYISGRGIARGYLNSPGLTAEKFIKLGDKFKVKEKETPREQNPNENMSHMSYKSYISHTSYTYRTGDLARRLPDGNIEFLGRRDHQVKIRGYRIELAEIEQQLLQHPGIKEALVTARNPAEKSVAEEKQDQYLCAYFVAENPLSTTQISDYLSSRLPHYMVPLFFVQLEKIPLTGNGKVDKKVLPIPGIEKEKDYVPPRDETGKKLVAIWSEVLRLSGEVISIEASFFELGGQSLKQIYLISRIHKEFNVNIPLAEIFKRPTIKKLAEYINTAAKDEYISIKAVEEREYYRLTSSQRRLYILQQLEPGSTVYNVPHLVTLTREIQKEKVEEIFRKIIKRHESLRTSFIIVEEEPAQRIYKEIEPGIENNDRITASPETIVREFIRPFDLARAPLLRVGLLELEKQKCLLMLDVHHIAGDGVSTEILVREFIGMYRGEPPAALRNSFKDYARWLQSPPVRDRIEKQEEYWLREYGEEVPVLNLYPDFPRPALQDFTGAYLEFGVGKEETAQLNRLAMEYEATLYMVLVAAFNILLSKLSGQEAIVIGVPLAARPQAGLENIIGMFVNTLVLKNYPHPRQEFAAFLQSVKTRTLQAFENQEYPFEDLVEKAPVERDASRNPLFDVMFSWLDMNREPAVENILDASPTGNPYRYNRQVAKFDMSWNGGETGGQLFFGVEYCTRLYKKETIARFIEYYKTILAVIAAHPHRKISRINMVPEAEKERILKEINHPHPGVRPGVTLHEMCRRQAGETPARTAAVLADRHITYRVMQEKANRLAGQLRSKGVKPGIIAGILIDHSFEMLIAILGVLKAGGAYLPMDPQFPDQRIQYMIRDSQAVLMLSQTTLKHRTAAAVETIDLHGQILETGETTEPGNINTPVDIAYVIYTSGSTGKPKGVMVKHGGAVNYIQWARDYYVQGRKSHLPLYSSLSVDLTVTSVYLPLVTGGSVNIYPHEEGGFSIEKIIEQSRVQVVKVTPAHMRLIEEMDIGGTRVEKFIVGGEELPHALAEAIYEKFARRIQIYNEYGPTETVVGSTIYEYIPGRVRGLSVPIGKPVRATRVYLLDSQQNLVPRGVPGEIYLESVGAARGYINRPELTAEKFDRELHELTPIGITSNQKFLQGGQGGTVFSKRVPPGRRRQKIYRTGDLARVQEDGGLEFLGRRDHQVKIRGYRVELAEIEHCLLSHEDINAVVVTSAADPDRPRENRLCAYVVQAKERTAAELRNYLEEKLPPHMIPAHFIKVENIPVTTSGKIDRKALAAYGTRLAAVEKYTGPRNHIEKEIALLWKETLQLERVGIENFFDIGGTSLEVIKLSKKINRRFDLREPVMLLFRYTTIAGLSRYISRGEAAAGTRRRSTPITEDLEKTKRTRQQQRNKRRGK